MENRKVFFNCLRLHTTRLLQSLVDNGEYTITDIKELVYRTHGISDEELRSVQTARELWDMFIGKGVINMDNVAILKIMAEGLKCDELKNEIEDYEWKITGKVWKVLAGVAEKAVILLKTSVTKAPDLATKTILFFTLIQSNKEHITKAINDYVLPYGMKLLGFSKGSVYFMVETKSLSSLKQLWTSYKDGSLREKLKKVINEIQEVRELTDGTEIDMTVEIDEEEYREACWLLVSSQVEQAEVEQVTNKSDVTRQRRHSLSCERDLPARTKPHLTWQEWKILKEAQDRLAIETRRRKDAEKEVAKLTEELKLLKPVDTVKSKEEDIITLEGKNQDIISELGPSYSTDPKLLVKLQEAIQNQENRLKVAEDTGDMIGEGIACRDIGTIYCVLGKNYKKAYDEVKCREAMEKGESYLKRAIDCLERFASQLSNEEKLKNSLFNALFVIYKLLTAVLIDTHKVEKALLAFERSRDRALIDIMIKRYEMTENKVLSDSLKYTDVCTLLPDKKSLCVLSFAIRDESINLWTLDYQELLSFLEKAVKLPSGSELKESVEVYMANLVDAEFVEMGLGERVPETSETELSYQDVTPLEVLYDLLVAPVLTNLTQDEIVIIADGPLHMVPFAALRDSKTRLFLSETKRIRYVPSLTAMKVWQECPADFHEKKGALIVGGADVGEVILRGERCIIPSLPAAKHEAQIISAILNVRPIVGRQVTKDLIMRMLEQDVAVIHISGHGTTEGEIVLVPSSSTRNDIPEEQDYILTVKEVQEMRVKAKLVVLTVNNSGRGEIKGGGVFSMSRAFLAAGARSVVASLWDLDDYATLNFMASFYMYLKMGESAGKSLQKAMKDMREEGYSEPRHWAPFILIGDDVTISV